MIKLISYGHAYFGVLFVNKMHLPRYRRILGGHFVTLKAYGNGFDSVSIMILDSPPAVSHLFSIPICAPKKKRNKKPKRKSHYVAHPSFSWIVVGMAEKVRPTQACFINIQVGLRLSL